MNSSQYATINWGRMVAIGEVVHWEGHLGKSWFYATDGPYKAIIEFDSLSVIPSFLNTYKSGPSYMMTFDQEPTSESLMRGNSSYTWLNSFHGKSGVAYFNGVNQSIDLMRYSEPGQSVFPPVIGGDVSFEGWMVF